MSDPFVGQIIPVAFNFAPVGWLLCNGSLQPISEYNTLYTVLGTMYGGDGQITFGLPDLRGRAVLGMGQGTGLPAYPQGQVLGSENITLTASQIGPHTHGLTGAATGTNSTPTTNTVLGTSANQDIYASSGNTTTLAPSSVGAAPGGTAPHENRQPYQVVNYIICYNGIFPTQS